MSTEAFSFSDVWYFTFLYVLRLKTRLAVETFIHLLLQVSGKFKLTGNISAGEGEHEAFQDFWWKFPRWFEGWIRGDGEWLMGCRWTGNTKDKELG